MRTFILLSFIAISFNSFAKPRIYADLIEGKFKAGTDDAFEKEIYLGPDGKSPILGKLKFYYSNDVLVTKFVNANTDKIYNSPSFEGRCGDSKYVFSLIENPTVKNGFTNIGEGPWGKVGWVSANEIDSSKEEYAKLGITKNCVSEIQPSEAKVKPLETSDGEDLYAIDLVPGEFNEINTEKKCTPQNYSKIPERCEIYEKNCHYIFVEERLFPPVSIEAPGFKGNVLVEIPHLDLLKIADKKENNYSSEYLAPNSDAIIYLITTPKAQKDTFKNSTEISQHHIKVGTSKIEVSMPKDLVEVEFIFVKGNSNIIPGDLSLDNYPVDGIFEDEPIMIKLGKGNYKIEITDIEHKLKFKKEIKVNGDEKQKILVHVKAEELKEDSSNRIMSVDSSSYKFRPNYNGRDIGEFKSAKVMSLEGNSKKDISNLFHIKNGKLVSTESGTKTLFYNKKINRFEVDGMCTFAKEKSVLHSYRLFSPDKKKEIGTLNALYTPGESNGIVSFYYESPTHKRESFQPNWENQKCGGRHFSSHFVESTDGMWSDLGAGPWGNHAWINLQASRIEEMGRKYNSGNLTHARLRKENDRNYVLEKEGEDADAYKAISLTSGDIRSFNLSTSCANDY